MVFSLLFGAIALRQLATHPAPAFVGSWVGTLEYRDYSDDSREKLGTLLRIYQPKGSSDWVFRYVYDDGPKKVVQESEMISLDWANHKYILTSEDGKEKDSYDLDGRGLKVDGTGTLVMTGKGSENRVDVDIRTTMKITRNHLDIQRQSRLKGQRFKFRHEYSFSRVVGS
jgi:hypothetical protein